MIEYRGPLIRIFFEANELSSGQQIIQLADGYTYERIIILYSETSTMLSPAINLNKRR